MRTVLLRASRELKARSNRRPIVTSMSSVPSLVLPAEWHSRYCGAMPFPEIPRRTGIAAVTCGRESTTDSPTRVKFVSKAEMSAAAIAGGSLAAADAEREGVTVQYVDGARVLTASLGKSPSLESVRKAATAVVSKLRALRVPAVDIVLPAVAGVSPAVVAAALVQSALLTNYAFDRYITNDDKLPRLVAAINVVTEEAHVVAAVERAVVLANATIFARDLGNERSDEITPSRLEFIASTVAGEIGADLHVVRGDALITAGMHLMAAVGQAGALQLIWYRYGLLLLRSCDVPWTTKRHYLSLHSITHTRPIYFRAAARHPPRYVELLYHGDPEHSDDLIMVLGKGITFDSGGLNIKGTGNMEDMHVRA